MPTYTQGMVTRHQFLAGTAAAKLAGTYSFKEMVKNLQLRLRGNFPRKFFENGSGDTGWNEYRFIVNYNF